MAQRTIRMTVEFFDLVSGEEAKAYDRELNKLKQLEIVVPDTRFGRTNLVNLLSGFLSSGEDVKVMDYKVIDYMPPGPVKC